MTIYGDANFLCRCVKKDGSPDALLVDETAISLGVNCHKCGKSAEHRLTVQEREEMRSSQRRYRNLKEIAA